MFCGASGKMTREHIFRRKWAEMLGGPPQKEWPAREQRDFGWTRTAQGSAETWERTYKARTFDATLKDVCFTCNNGWMNDLENAVEPFIVPLVWGHYVRLSRQESTDLARWIAKTSLVLSKSFGCANSYTVEQARTLADGGMPDDVHTWVLARPLESLLWPHMTPLLYSDGAAAETNPLPMSDTSILTVSFMAACFISMNSTQPRLNKRLGRYGRQSCGKQLHKRRRAWKAPREVFNTRYKEMAPDYHSALLQGWADRTNLQIAGGTNFPLSG